MPVEAGDILRLTPTIRAGQTSTRVQNRYWWQVLEVADDAFASVRDDFGAWLGDLYDILGPWQASTTVADGFRMVNVTKNETFGAGTWNYDGNNPALEMLPPQVAAQMIGYTAKAGRFGRKYFGPIVEDAQADGNWSAALMLDLQSFADAWVQQLVGTVSGNSYRPGLARKPGAVWEFEEFSSDLGTFVTPQARTQRRRTAGFGLT